MRALSMTVPRSARLVSSSGVSDDDVHGLGETDAELDVDLGGLADLRAAYSVRVFFWNPLISTVRV